MCQGALSRVSNMGEHYQVSKRGSSGYGPIYGSYCQCGPQFEEAMSHFGTVASFNILMQNFYKVTQDNNEKVPFFAMRLEGTLNQIRLQCPGRMTDLEVQQHLKDHLFQGVQKHIQDSMQYLYSTPRSSYSQLMVAACKAESKNKEIWDKVRARAAVATDSGKGTAELGQQIAQLMAALIKSAQGGNPSSAPSSPWERGCGRG